MSPAVLRRFALRLPTLLIPVIYISTAAGLISCARGSGSPTPIGIDTTATTPSRGTPAANVAPPLSLSAVYFVDPLHGWVAGSSVILATRDGGSTWRQEYAGPETIDSIYAVDPDHAWAIGDSALLRTEDGGSTWSVASEPPGPVRSLTFIDPRVGVAVGSMSPVGDGALYQTGDGGTSWQRVITPEPVVAACVRDSRHLYVVGTPPLEPTASIPGLELFSSGDGGGTWTKLLSVAPRDLMSAGGANGSPVAAQLACVDESTLWFLALGLPAHLATRPFLVYRSTDAGAQWRQLLSGPPAGGPYAMLPTDFEVIGDKTALIGGDCGSCPVSQVHKLLATTNAGQVWDEVPLPNGLSSSTQSECSVSFANEMTGWMIVSTQVNSQTTSAVWATTDGGQSWYKQYPTSVS